MRCNDVFQSQLSASEDVGRGVRVRGSREALPHLDKYTPPISLLLLLLLLILLNPERFRIFLDRVMSATFLGFSAASAPKPHRSAKVKR